MASTPEGKIKGKLDKMLKEEGVWFYSPQSGIYGRSGIPDRVAIVSGRFVGIECKARYELKPTDLQMKTMLEITNAGGRCFVAYDTESIEIIRAYIQAVRTREGLTLS